MRDCGDNITISILSGIFLYGVAAVASIYNLGVIAAIAYISLLIVFVHQSPRNGILALTMPYFMPTDGLHIPGFMLTSTIIVLILHYKLILQSTKNSELKLLILVFTVFTILRGFSILIVDNHELFFRYFLWTAYTLLQLLIIKNLIRSSDDIHYIVKWLCVIGCLATVLGYYHFVNIDSVYQSQIASSLDLKQKGIIDYDIGWIRWIWAGVEPNFHGLQMLIPFAFATGYLIQKQSLPNVAIWIFSYLGVIGTFSRSSFLASLGIIFTFILISYSKRKYAYLVLVILAFVALIQLFPDYIERIETISENIDRQGGTGRFFLWKEAIYNFYSHPYIGIGTGQTVLFSRTAHETHNTFLQILGEGGILTFCIFIYIFIWYFRYAFSIRKFFPVYFALGVGLVINMSTVSLFDMRVVILIFVLLSYEYYYTRKVNT